jgi:hypothetical protein
MGLPVSEFDASPFDEIQRLHNNMTKLIQTRKQDLSYADEFLKGIYNKNAHTVSQTNYCLDSEAFLSTYITRVKELDAQLSAVEDHLNKLPPQMDERVSPLSLSLTFF